MEKQPIGGNTDSTNLTGHLKENSSAYTNVYRYNNIVNHDFYKKNWSGLQPAPLTSWKF